MNIAAIICEYNPFHRGHEKQLQWVRQHLGEDTVIVSVMSGNFVQRGEPAIFPKELRAAEALRHGVDLVLELPYPFSCAVGERFAAAGVHIAGAIGAKWICFGIESDFSVLKKASAFDLRNASLPLHHALPPIVARERAFAEETGIAYPTGHNDRLAISYLQALQRDPVCTGLTPLPLRREKDGFSAHRAREALLRGEDAGAWLPDPASYRSHTPATLRRGYPTLSALLCAIESEELTGLFDLPKEIAVRLTAAARRHPDDFDRFFAALQNKNDTDARLRRSLVTVLLRPQIEDLQRLPDWTWLLGANERGRTLLRKIRKEGAFRVVTKRADAPQDRQAQLGSRADLLYGVFSGESIGEQALLSRRPLLL